MGFASISLLRPALSLVVSGSASTGSAPLALRPAVDALSVPAYQRARLALVPASPRQAGAPLAGLISASTASPKAAAAIATSTPAIPHERHARLEPRARTSPTLRVIRADFPERGAAGRMVMSGRLADVCDALDRMTDEAA